MAEPDEDVKRVEVPLLKAYLRGERSDPPHMPGWITPAGWATFLLLAAGADAIDAGSLGGLVAIISAVALVYFLRRSYGPRNEVERMEEIHYSSVKKLKGMVDDGLDRRLPPAVLTALEEAVGVYNMAVARLSAEPGLETAEQIAVLRRTLHASFVVSVPVMRGDQCSKREWKAILANARLIGDVVDTIHAHVARMRAPSSLDNERLTALRELEAVEEPRTLKVND
ncbi:MAG: hypothetical protein ACO1SV_04505 [Fimbriimonas sp.]